MRMIFPVCRKSGQLATTAPRLPLAGSLRHTGGERGQDAAM